jgi:hypothetical protein
MLGPAGAAQVDAGAGATVVAMGRSGVPVRMKVMSNHTTRTTFRGAPAAAKREPPASGATVGRPNTSGFAFDMKAIQKALPRGSRPPPRRPHRPTGRGQTGTVKKLVALRNGLVCDNDARDICEQLEGAAINSEAQRVVFTGSMAVVKARADSLPLRPFGQLRFVMESDSLRRGTLTVASVGETASATDRLAVVSTTPSDGECEVVVQNLGAQPVVGPFVLRLSVFAMGNSAPSAWR